MPLGHPDRKGVERGMKEREAEIPGIMAKETGEQREGYRQTHRYREERNKETEMQERDRNREMG